MKTLNCYFMALGICCMCVNVQFAQTLNLKWKKNVGERIIAAPLTHEGKIFIGDEAGVFFALDLKTGTERWRYQTNGNIQAKALLVEDHVFFESANKFYLLDGATGKQKWVFDSKMKAFNFKYQDREYPYKIDPYDDKRSIGTYHDGKIFVGCGNGSLYALSASSGKVEMKLKTIESSPIRSSPYIHDDKLYFGDWNGMVYCYDLEKKELLWTKKTYRGGKPYGTFGGVVSEFLVHDGLLFFGARNYMLNTLLADSGEKEWTYTDPQGGWMIGDPVIFKDTLYLGGSDNLSMFAFNPAIGRIIWKQKGGKNIYTKPVVNEKYLIYTAGNGYDAKDSGKIFLLNRKDGKVIDEMETPMGIFSSPVLVEDQIVFGCYDGNVYCLSLKE